MIRGCRGCRMDRDQREGRKMLELKHVIALTKHLYTIRLVTISTTKSERDSPIQRARQQSPPLLTRASADAPSAWARPRPQTCVST
jgi:hypothetical protein